MGLRVGIDLTPLEMLDRHGGIGRYTVHLLTQLSEMREVKDADVTIFAAVFGDKPLMPAEDALEAARHLPKEVSVHTHRSYRRNILGRSIREAKIDLFHSTEPGIAPTDPGCPVVATSYDIVPAVLPDPTRLLGFIKDRVDFYKLKNAYEKPQHLLAISQTTKNDIVRVLGIPQTRVSVAHLGVDPLHFSAVAPPGERETLIAKHSLPEKYFVCVSSDHYRKNHRSLFEAWTRVADSIPEGLVFVGKSLYEKTLQDIQREVEKKGLGARFRWLKNVSDAELPAFYRHSTAAVAPSLYEGFGMTILEAMASGAPMFAARNGAYDEVGGEGAEYFEPTDVDAIATGLVRFSKDASWRNAVRERGLTRAPQLSWRNTAERSFDVYKRMLGL